MRRAYLANRFHSRKYFSENYQSNEPQKAFIDKSQSEFENTRKMTKTKLKNFSAAESCLNLASRPTFVNR